MAPEGGARPRVMALECVRGVAALYVFVHHYGHALLVTRHPSLARLFPFGQLAVITFFVTSGFVIEWSTSARGPKPPWSTYLLQRFRRIYPPFLIALVVSWAGAMIRYRAWLVPSLRDLAGNLLMMQDWPRPGWFVGPLFDNMPLWSLSYECWFYLLFYPTYWIAKRLSVRPAIVALALSAAGFALQHVAPTPPSLFVSYYVIWWAGVELAREYRATGQVTFRGQALSLASVALGIAAWTGVIVSNRPVDLFAYPGYQLRHFVTALAVIVAGMVWYRLGGRGFSLLFGWAGRLAAVSYGIYVFHQPMVHLAAGLGSSPYTAWIWVAPVVLGAAYLVEVVLQPRINAVLGGRRAVNAAPRAGNNPGDTPSLAGQGAGASVGPRRGPTE